VSDTEASLRRKIKSASDLQSVVRTMKAVAASSIGQYEKSVLALSDYYRAVELGLSTCFRNGSPVDLNPRGAKRGTGVIVFGSDQGLVGQFNEVVTNFTINTLATLPGKPYVWAVGERVYSRLMDAGLTPLGLFAVPNSVKAIASLVGQIQIESQAHRNRGEYSSVYIFHNRPKSGALYEPVSQRMLPLDNRWQKKVAEIHWPTHKLPEVMGNRFATLRALMGEYLFISLFQACAESLASENASRLAAMQRAEKNIDELLENLQGNFHRLRQDSIDEELFDVIAGFEALKIV
jgi:F-type H+-transporting ATPase subunit gamma